MRCRDQGNQQTLIPPCTPSANAVARCTGVPCARGSNQGSPSPMSKTVTAPSSRSPGSNRNTWLAVDDMRSILFRQSVCFQLLIYRPPNAGRTVYLSLDRMCQFMSDYHDDGVVAIILQQAVKQVYVVIDNTIQAAIRGVVGDLWPTLRRSAGSSPTRIGNQPRWRSVGDFVTGKVFSPEIVKVFGHQLHHLLQRIRAAVLITETIERFRLRRAPISRGKQPIMIYILTDRDVTPVRQLVAARIPIVHVTAYGDCEGYP